MNSFSADIAEEAGILAGVATELKIFDGLVAAVVVAAKGVVAILADGLAPRVVQAVDVSGLLEVHTVVVRAVVHIVAQRLEIVIRSD